MRKRGFSLVEVLVGTAILGLALLLAARLTSQGARASDRLLAQRTALREVQNCLERVEAGELPLVSGPVARGPGAAGAVVLEVTPAEPRGVYRVRAECVIRGKGRPVRRHLTTLVWRKS